jgi:PAS domain S-box-containing protein
MSTAQPSTPAADEGPPSADTAGRGSGPAGPVPAASGEDASYHMRRLVDHAPSMMAYWDRNLLCRFANRAYELWFGADPDQLVGRSIVELLGPRLFALNEPYMRAALGGEAQRFERIVPGPDGVQRHSLATYVPDVVDGVVVGFMAQVTDVSPLKQTQAELQAAIERLEAEARLRRSAEESLFDVQQSLGIALASIGAGFVGTDASGRITRFNAVAQSVFEWPEDEAVGQPYWDVFKREGRPPGMEARNPIDVMLASQTPEQAVHGAMAISRTGRRTPLEIHAGLTRAEDGRAHGLAVVFRDLTQSRLADQERERHLEELRRSNAELEQFAYVASHDLQEPLRMVANYTELLAKRYQGRLDERADKYIHYASDGARRMHRLVSDLLTFSRVGSQGQPMVPTSSQQALQHVLDTMQPLVRDAGAQVEFHDLPVVAADEDQLQQLFQNLIANAIKFRADAAPRIVVSAVPEGRRWHFSVADNGIGLEMRFAERIFQMFQRLHELGRYEGSGIGLAIAKRIVERHGGRIWVESAPGTGTTVHFTLIAATLQS